MTSVSKRLAAVRKYFARDFATHMHRLASWVTGPVERVQARRAQDRYVKTFVGITGSVGKSTASYLTAELLATGGSAELGVNFNTPRYILRTLRKLRRPVDAVVQEISGHKPGAIAHVTKTVRIDVAVVTTVGLDHLTNFRTNEAVAAEKVQLVAAIGETGIACLNADDPLVRAMAAQARGRVILFGRSTDAEVRAENVSAIWPARLSFDLVIGGQRRHVETRFVGTLLLTSILAAISVTHGLGRDVDAALARLLVLEPLSRRLSVARGTDGHEYVIDDTKASTWSTFLLVEDLQNWGNYPRVFVLGELSDTGSESSRKYRRILRIAAESCGCVIGVQRAASAAERLARTEKRNGVFPARNLDDVRRIIAEQPPSLVILKGNSRAGSDAHLSDVMPEDTARPAPIQIRRTVGQ